MKKILLLPFVLLTTISCSNDNDTPTQVQEKHEANFSLTKNIGRADWTNIQTGEPLKFDIKIKDFDTSADVVYVLKPITADATKHQRNKVDYNFQEGIKIAVPSILNPSHKDSVLTKVTRDSILLKKPNASFYISTLKPGNFIHQYKLQKMKGNKYVSEATQQEISFSVVTLDMYTRSVQIQNETLFRHSIHERYYEFTIDDGDQSNDTYLTNSDTKTNSYQALYNGNKYPKTTSQPLTINQTLSFSDAVRTEGGGQTVPNWTLSELKIIQKRNGEPDVIISYTNLTIKQK